MELILVLILFGFLTALVAAKKGRSGCAWYFIGFLLGPFGLIASLVVSADEEVVEANAIESGKSIKCPQCAELIKAEAKVCRFCGAKFTNENNEETQA